MTLRFSSVLFPMVFFLVMPLSAAEEGEDSVLFSYIHRQGAVLHTEALVREQVRVDGFLSHDAEITESSISRILNVGDDGVAELSSEFITEETVAGAPGYREWLSSETVSLSRDRRGRMTVPESAFRPVLRNIPVFPEYPLKPGESWSAPAEEVHVFRIGGGLYGPYRSEFHPVYRFLDHSREGYSGVEGSEGRHLARIGIEYNLYLNIPGNREPVRRLVGTSSQILYWDISSGSPWYREETFEFVVFMSDGQTQEIAGAQRVRYRESEQMDRQAVLSDLEGRIPQSLSMDVKPVERGILMTLDEEGTILFDPESSRVRPEQVRKIQTLSGILRDYSDRDILISGHTALYGSEEGRRDLSLRRARAVADLLFPEGRSGAGRLFLRGMGAGQPVGSDMENRRVEILILD